MNTHTFFAGVDVGSAAVKVVLLDEADQILSQAVLPTSGVLADSFRRALDQAVDSAGLHAQYCRGLIATGYGRDRVEGRIRSVTEITCHARGARFFYPEARSVIDIGGQDSKAIALDEGGRVLRFEMNDKCAAGTGRFLEVMARLLEIELDQFGGRALAADAPVAISSTCTVFAESEVISWLAQNQPVNNIAAGLCRSIASRVFGLASRVRMTGPTIMTGGVARNPGVVHALEELLGEPLLLPGQPQLAGALGAALFAKDSVLSSGGQ
ncbi:MAG TPA: acyl-CoA dehydratase activase [Candidatus Hydrogenedentes bacterium]|jgi:predicted CoA-substrate-specific enzyme activase|nr:MAG: R-phenyllactate dehydratase activator [Candidatus Hydrogenedentes bacterium ADurb.Bin170]HNZ47540.1 acyl-CoA dehydratase activase [Candidatus Hydrogenedentota bacterium]HPK24537.1 acyl-CoA dehydratase activase [Candidatus Hydrogenedentota bacterium]HPX86126.1 acyl-CoA dehydratase activase [Candidatus Hydrogenedentota bacterium]HQB04287.1 acyl-CoA dehydratase activase [Candidatus Hydrogenedentota bacterium]